MPNGRIGLEDLSQQFSGQTTRAAAGGATLHAESRAAKETSVGDWSYNTPRGSVEQCPTLVLKRKSRERERERERARERERD